MHLYIDTTSTITIGLLSESLDWVDYFNDPKIVISTKLHGIIQNLLSKHLLSFEDLESFIYCAGPGSYTGMRVAEGIADILRWKDFRIFNFYHYEVPQMLNYKKGLWFSNAFKGEKFIYEWSDTDSSKKLIVNDHFESLLNNYEDIFTNENLDGASSKNTNQMIKENPQDLFTKVIKENSTKKLFYYRELEEEFKRC